MHRLWTEAVHDRGIRGGQPVQSAVLSLKLRSSRPRRPRTARSVICQPCEQRRHSFSTVPTTPTTSATQFFFLLHNTRIRGLGTNAAPLLAEGLTMKFRVERDDLADAVAWVARTLPNRPTTQLQVLAGLLLETALVGSAAVRLRLRGGGPGRDLGDRARRGPDPGQRPPARRDHPQPSRPRRWRSPSRGRGPC